MKKLLALAITATLLTAGSAFAVERHLTPLISASGAPGIGGTTDNAASCDIGVTPAATLLLPYFEVDTAATSGNGATTLFTVTNTSRYPQIAHVTVWTDWSFPVLDFNIFLTGYDVQGISLYDVIVRGTVAGSGTSVTTAPGTQQSGTITGTTPLSNTSNPNFLASVGSTCNGLPGNLPGDLVTAVRNALTTGTGYSTGGVSCSGAIGANHGTIAKGYVTVDVAATCSTALPTNSSYYTGASAEILFDNVLIGDYQQLGPSPTGAGTTAGYDAGGNPMVHIRAVPEGGLSGAAGGTAVPTILPFTFYDRYTPTGARTADRRQPLPSQWAARYIQNSGAGYATDYKIWREGVTSGTAGCAVSANSALVITSIVRFDEHENSYGFGTTTICSPCSPGGLGTLPETSRTSTTANLFPTLGGTDVGGWMYLNLSDQSTSAGGPAATAGVPVTVYSSQRAGFGSVGAVVPGSGASGSRTTSQNWVIISLFGAIQANRLSVDFDAAWLGNGCTPAPVVGAVIAPAQEFNGNLVCPNVAAGVAGAAPNCSTATFGAVATP